VSGTDQEIVARPTRFELPTLRFEVWALPHNA
jgi:hypothetical protein